MVFAHATGFCGSVWRPVREALRTPVDAWTLDVRGHGRSGTPEGEFRWEDTASDVLAVLDAVRGAAGDRFGGPVIGVGHSMGGAAVLLAEIARPGTFAAIWAYEPIVIPADIVAATAGMPNPLAVGARRRRAAFASRAEARANYASKPPMNTFVPAALDAYIEGAMLDEPDGSARLACRPEVEAGIYQSGSQHSAWDRLGEVACPVVVAAGREEPFSPAAFAARIAERLPHGRLERHDEMAHFGPMERPASVAASIDAVLHTVLAQLG